MRGLLVGRFQPFHLGHVAVVRHLRTERPDETLILGIGSAEESYTFSNPFTAAERYEMIARSLKAEHLEGWVAVPIPDIHRHALWVAHVVELLPTFERVYTNNPLTRTLFERGGFEVESPPVFDREKFEGTAIRRLLREGTDAWSERVPTPVAAYLRSLPATDRLRALAANRDE
ncbi:MAG TPA: nicotinamide-nucleotide adenylyltransferase [Thermoplasmata archaeon]|nr:nicotinamide-nucleotide adenylyltransferase [Thermoplasmata archaeon]